MVHIDSIDFGTYLDAKDKRKKSLMILRDRCLVLMNKWYEWYRDIHPFRRTEKEAILHEVQKEMCLLMQDYQSLMYDYEKDWNLNFTYETETIMDCT